MPELLHYISIILIFASCITQIWGHILYNKLEGIEPNVTSWSIWGITGLLEAANYAEMTGDPYKNWLPFVCSLCCTVTFFICLGRGRFKLPSRSQCVTFLIYFVAMIVWKKYSMTTSANMILQVDNAISFYWILGVTWNNPSKEHPRPWAMWTVSYFLATLVVVVRYEQPQDLVFPLLSALLHGLVCLFAMRHKRVVAAA